MYANPCGSNVGLGVDPVTVVAVATGVKELFGGKSRSQRMQDRIQQHLRGEGPPPPGCQGPFTLAEFERALRVAPPGESDRLWQAYVKSQGGERGWFKSLYPVPDAMRAGNINALRNLAMGGADCYTSTRGGQDIKEAATAFATQWGRGNLPDGTVSHKSSAFPAGTPPVASALTANAGLLAAGALLLLPRLLK